MRFLAHPSLLQEDLRLPDDFVLLGSWAQQWARLGNALPPVMMIDISATLRDGVLARISGGISQGEA